jgi:hypothetical protein
MNWYTIRFAGALLAGIFLLPFFISAQNNTATNPAAPENVAAEYPKDQVGILIQNSGWTAVPGAYPSKTRVMNGIAASLTYSAVPAGIRAEYEGLHAAVQLMPGRPVICICHVISIPGAPVLVRLHPKKSLRELDGGRLPLLGAKMSEAKQSDLVPAEVSQPENSVWLVRPTETLPAGEYALMLGTQNMSIFPFTVSSPAGDSAGSVPSKH